MVTSKDLDDALEPIYKKLEKLDSLDLKFLLTALAPPPIMLIGGPLSKRFQAAKEARRAKLLEYVLGTQEKSKK